jgi:predicted Zn-dependent protease
VLQEWIDQPVAPGVSLKAFLMRLILASNLSRAGLVAHLQQRRAQVAAHQLDLKQTARVMDDGIDLGERLALEYGLAVATAELTWLDRALDQLSRHPLPAEAG